MGELIVFLAAEDACDWMLVTTNPSGPASGNATRVVDLPLADRVIAIVPAAAMRTLALQLPPTPADKRQSVVRFALEEQLAGDIDAQHVVVAAERERDVVVHAIDRGWLSRIVRALAAKDLRPSGIFAESDLAPHRPGTRTWIWHEDGGFLIDPSGRVSILDRGADALPSGLLLALRNAAAGEAPVVIHGPASLADSIDGWTRATGVAFELAPEWSWRNVDRAQLQRAPNLLTPELESGAVAPPRVRRVDWLARAAGWAAAALLLHTGASVADWAVLKWRAGQLERETTALIQAAAPALTGDLDAGWRRTFAAARHRQGRAAPDDALPLIAEAALGLTALPAGALRVINYEGGQLTLDFASPAAPAIATALPAWNAHGLAVLQADAAGGVRVRLTRQ
jgi:general secretion pathway protein L